MPILTAVVTPGPAVWSDDQDVVVGGIDTPDNPAGNTDDATVRTGNATGGDSGDILLGTGTATGTRGTVQSLSRLTTTDGVVGGTARVVGGQAFASIADSSPRINGAGNTPFDVSYPIPANTLQAGSTVRVWAIVRVTAANGATLSLIGRCDAANDVIGIDTGLTSVAVGTTAMLEWWFTTRAAAGAAVDSVGGGFGIFTTAGGGGAAVGASSTMPNGATLATNAVIEIDVTATWSVMDNSSCYLESLIVDIF